MQVKPLLIHNWSMTSTYDSAESIATSPPESDLDNKQRIILTSPLYLQGRIINTDRSRVYHFLSENPVSNSSHFRESTGKPVTRESGHARPNRIWPVKRIWPKNPNLASIWPNCIWPDSVCVCVFKIFGWCLRPPPPPDPPSAGPSFRRTAQNFALFFLSPAGNFILSSLSGGYSR